MAYWVAIAVVIAGTLAAHFIHLGADTPQGLPDQIGLYVDEGYKTLSPRNLVLFEQTHWHPADDYPGWFLKSPVTQTAFLIGFKQFGQSLVSARIVSVLWLLVLLIALAFGFGEHRSLGVVTCGILMLGFEHVMWIFSRVAIFEIAGIALLYGTLLLLRPLNKRLLIMIAAFVVAGLVTVRGIKFNAAYVLLPGFVGMMASAGIGKWSPRQIFSLSIVGVIACLAPVIITKAGLPLPFDLSSIANRVDLFPVIDVFERFVGSSILKADPLLLMLGGLSALSLLLHHPDGFIRNPYRCAVLSIAFLGMATLALTGGARSENNLAAAAPLRYCVWVLPAYLLLMLEWWSARRAGPDVERAATDWSHVSRGLAFGVLVLMVAQIGYLALLGLSRVSSVAPPHEWVFLGVVAAAIGVAVAIWRYRDRALSVIALQRTLCAVFVVWGCVNASKVAGYVLNPTWEVRTISAELEQALPANASVAGDWAPLFALGTDVRALYMNPRQFNKPERINELQPTHFLYCEVDNGYGDDGMAVQQVIEEADPVSIGAPLLETDYAGRKVILYPLTYETPSSGSGNPQASTNAYYEHNQHE